MMARPFYLPLYRSDDALSRFDNPTNGADTISGTHFNLAREA